MDRLAAEATAALQAGMSYGKWKALGGHIEKPAEEHKVVRKGICQNCGKEFEMYDRRQRKYCSLECNKQMSGRMALRRWREKNASKT